MKKLKRISAALMVILLAGLFIAAIVLAITGAPANQLMAVIFSIVFISVLFYAMGLMTRVLKKDDSKDTSDTSLKNSQPLVCNAGPVIYEKVYQILNLFIIFNAKGLLLIEYHQQTFFIFFNFFDNINLDIINL